MNTLKGSPSTHSIFKMGYHLPPVRIPWGRNSKPTTNGSCQPAQVFAYCLIPPLLVRDLSQKATDGPTTRATVQLVYGGESSRNGSRKSERSECRLSMLEFCVGKAETRVLHRLVIVLMSRPTHDSTIEPDSSGISHVIRVTSSFLRWQHLSSSEVICRCRAMNC